MKLSPLFLSLALTLGGVSAPAYSAEETAEAPGVEDRAGVLKLDHGVLYTLPEDQEGVLTALGAKPVGEGLWSGSFRDVTGGRTSVRFQVVPVWELEPYWPRDSGDPVPCPNPDIQIFKNSVCSWPDFMPADFGCQNSGTGSSDTDYYNYKICRRQAGGGYCVNESSVISATMWYGQANCAGPIVNITTNHAMTCG